MPKSDVSMSTPTSASINHLVATGQPAVFLMDAQKDGNPRSLELEGLLLELLERFSVEEGQILAPAVALCSLATDADRL